MTAPLQLDARPRGVLAHTHAAELAGATQRGEHEPGIDAVVLGRLQRQSQGRRKRRLELARVARPQPCGAQAQRLAEGELALQLARLVLVAREEQRAGLAQPDLDAGGPLKLGGEAGPHVRGAQPELEHSSPGLPELDLGDGREHAGGDARSAFPADRAPLEHDDRHPAQPHPPGDGKADDPAPDDGDIGRSSIAWG